MQHPLLAQCISSASVANQRGQYDLAIGWCQQALHLAPNLPEGWYNLGLAFRGKGQTQKAKDALLKAASLAQDNADAQNSIGLQFIEIGAYPEAERCLEKSINLAPDFAFAYSNLGKLRDKQRRYLDAEFNIRQAVALNPNLPELWGNLGSVLLALRKYELAAECFRSCLNLNPGYDFILGYFLHTQMHLCNWSAFRSELARLLAAVEKGNKACHPFHTLGLTADPGIQKKAALIYATVNYREQVELGPIPKYVRREKIRIAYLSADFKNHPVTFLTAELFELHDRSRFEVFGVSFGQKAEDEMRERVESAFDLFLDVSEKSDREIALLLRKHEVDIAIDLGGYTENSRTGILAHRAAPIQVSYIGYLGTMGAPYIDYILADHTIIPEKNQANFSEKIAYIPSYQVNDRKREISERIFTREELGLPSEGFVFCCFNNNYKITPDTFQGWMRILKRVEGSALFLYADNTLAEANLKKEAERQGIEASRLVFSARIPRPEYLARYRVADLFLDTLPYNAGTTASDALWAGLPVLTRMGESFASRVAASLLVAIELPELIATDQENYEALAVELATNPDKLAQITQKLAQNRLTTPLFDTPRFSKHIEAAYQAMFERYQMDLTPEHIDVEQSF